MDERYAIGPVTITIKLSSDETAGKFALIEYELPPGFPGPPPDVHPGMSQQRQSAECPIPTRWPR
jgi:hypothetical protein